MFIRLSLYASDDFHMHGLSHVPGVPGGRLLGPWRLIGWPRDAPALFKLHPEPSWTAVLLEPSITLLFSRVVLAVKMMYALWAHAWAVALEVAVQISSLSGLGTIPVVSYCSVTVLDYFPMKDDYNKGH